MYTQRAFSQLSAATKRRNIRHNYLLDAVDAPLIGLSDVQSAQVRQRDGLGGLQGGANRRPPHQVVVNTGNLAVDGAACHDTHLKSFGDLKARGKNNNIMNKACKRDSEYCFL